MHIEQWIINDFANICLNYVAFEKWQNYTMFNKCCVFDDCPLVGCLVGEGKTKVFLDVPTFGWSKNNMFGDTENMYPLFGGPHKKPGHGPLFWR